ncbi:MAG: hypothetical protein ACOZCF_03130 [Bacillota bacterium]
MLNKVQEWAVLLIIVGISAIAGNFIGYKIPIVDAIPGMLILGAISLAGMILAKVIPVKFPAVAYIGLIGMLLTIPESPVAKPIVDYTSKVQFMAMATPVLAYAGIAIGKSWTDFTRLGWKSVVVALVVLFGTYIGSAIVAEIILRIQGII